MRFYVAQQYGLSHAHSPFRVVEPNGQEVEWVNRYLDQERVRGVADSTLRSYAHDLLHFLRWWAAAHKTSTITQQALTESTFLDYIRFQANQNPPPAAQSINRRVGTAERAMRRAFPEAARLFAPGFQNWYWRQSRLGYGRPRPALTQLRVISFALSSASPTWRPALTASKARGDWWISSSLARGRSNSPEGGPLIEVRAIMLSVEISFQSLSAWRRSRN